MQVRHLSLQHFRNYETAELALQPGANLIIGKNGQGKTNLVEAIMYFASLRSHRSAQESALIQAGHDAAIMRMTLGHGDREALCELQLNRKGANKAQLNRNTVRPRDLMRAITAVLFAPEDLTIARGEPAGRRRFLDDALTARYPAAAGVLSDYDRVLKQRNTLLKSARAHRAAESMLTTLHVWDEQLVDLGSQIIEHRRDLVNDLAEPLKQAYLTLVEDDHSPTLVMNESVAVTDVSDPANVSRETSHITAVDENVSRETISVKFRQALAIARPKELDRGQTLIGPHRDDLTLELNGLPVRGYASHGEHWSFVLSLRLALATLLKSESTLGDPVLILDDVFAELDEFRRNRLMAAVEGFEQIIVTAAVAGDVPANAYWNITRVHRGRILDSEESIPTHE